MPATRRRGRVASLVTALVAVLLLVAPAAPAGAAPGSGGGTGASAASASPPRIRAASFDPADYLSRYPDARALARTLVRQAAANGVNTLYVNAYNVQYGANYRTGYRFNAQSDYGRQDFLGHLLDEAHAHGIQVVAALYDHQHRGAWEARPSWRAKTESGGDYNPPRVDIQYFLSVGQPQAMAWWSGFLRDLLNRYPSLDGVELREPIVNWYGTSADWNPAVTAAFQAAHPGSPLGGEVWRTFRRQLLTRFLRMEIRIVHAAHRFVHVTTVADAYGSGHLMPAAAEARETGFDLDALVSGPDRPDAVKVEVIWQQWARVYDYVTFTPGWTGQAAREFLDQVRGRVPVVVHVELVRWPAGTITVDEFHREMKAAARTPGIEGVDFFTTFLADRAHAWPAVRDVYGRAAAPRSFAEQPRVLVLYDRGTGVAGAAPGLNTIKARFLANLLGHFRVDWEVRRMEDYRAGELSDFDVVLYQANVFGGASPLFLADVVTFRGTVVWIGANLFQIRDRLRLPMTQDTDEAVGGYTRAVYRGRSIPARGDVVVTRVQAGASVPVWLTGDRGRVPYVVRAGRFWYVAGSPMDYLESMNGRYVAFADLLHDMLGIGEPGAARRAFLRIEDVNPMSDPDAVRRLADVFAARHLPFQIGFFPFYVDPGRGLYVALSDRPQMVAALRYAVAKGGQIVLHGCTHQYKGVSGVDYEFWDASTGGPLPVDSESYVRGRVERALSEMWEQGFHPLAWSTPHYAASGFDYSVLNDYFTTFVGRRVYGVWGGSDYQQWAPYVIEADMHGARIVPENLGYVKNAATDPGRMIADARSLSVVRDAVVGGLVHLSVTPERLGWMLDRLADLGYRPFDLAATATIVQTARTVQVTGTAGAAIAVPSGWYLQRQVVGPTGSLVGSTLMRFASYARPVQSLGDAPAGSILTLHVSASARGLPGPTRLIGYPQQAPSGPFAAAGRAIGTGVTALGSLAILLLLGAYAGIKLRLRGRRGVRGGGAPA